MKYLNRGDKVIYLGVGGGNEAVHAARMGCRVTCVDISQGMLDRLQHRLDQEKLSAELICQSAFDHQRSGYYDAVATNYFLNVFREPMMVDMMKHASTLVRSGGRFMIADVSLPQGNLVYKTFNWLYLRWAMATCWMMGMVPWHKNYDYPSYFADANLKLDDVEFFRLAKFGPVVYQNIMATKV